MDPTTGEKNKKEEFTVSFKNGALARLKELAEKLGVPDEKLGDVLVKGIKIIEVSLGGKLIVEKDNQRFEIDPKKL